MKVSKYWARVSELAKNHLGEDYRLVVWSSSDVDDNAAKISAEAKMKQRVERLSNGEDLLDQYPYELDDSIREELIEEVFDEKNQIIAAITRNNYGALVLNAANVMFVDVDLPLMDTQKAQSTGFFARLFGKKAHDEKSEDNLRADYLEKFADFHQQHPEMAFRVYATKNGFRLLMLHDTFDPLDSHSESILNELESDTLYKNLCKGQQCYRARLTPKPWRCGLQGPPNRFPREDEHAQAKFDKWLLRYETNIKRYAVCKLVVEYEGLDTRPTIARVAELHDRYVLDGEKPLA